MKYTKKTMHLGAPPSTFRNAEFLRKNPTKAEEILWQKLRKNQMEGVRFRRQHPFVRYIPDFYAHAIKLVIEVDGEIHETEPVKFTDADRELNLKSHDLHILRYKNADIIDYEEDVVEDIRWNVQELLKAKKNKNG